jgi:hypothetical protein
MNNSIANFFDSLCSKRNIKNDAALAKVLDVQPPIISKLRHGTLTPGASIIIKIHEAFGDLSIKDIKAAIAA